MSRFLPSVQSADWVQANASLQFTYRGGGTATFPQQDIITLGTLLMETPAFGGLAKPAKFGGMISTSGDWIATNRKQLAGASLTLTVIVNSDQIQPFVGTIRSLDYDGMDPNKLGFTAYDRLLDSDPMLPAALITDSFATPHLEHLTDGQPAYYGNVSSRFIYLTAVTSNAGMFLGPTNVPSAYHAAPIKGRFQVDDTSSGFQFLQSSYGWNQQSGSDNVFVVGSDGLAVANVGSLAGTIIGHPTGPSYATFGQISGIDTASLQNLDLNGCIIPSNVADQSSHIAFTFNFDRSIQAARTIGFFAQGFGSATRPCSFTYADGVNSTIQSSFGVLIALLDVRSFGLGANGVSPTISFDWTTGVGGSTPQFEFGIVTIADGAAYKRYSVFAIGSAASNRVAISTNPIAQLDHILTTQTSLPYRQDQSSAAQVLVQSWQSNLQLGPERLHLSDLLDDFASTAGVSIWQADSGMIAYRAYQQSGSATVDRIVTPGDLLGLTIADNPLGITVTNYQPASKFSVSWGYVYHTGQYAKTSIANPQNNAFCSSAYAAGIQGEQDLSSKWILDSDTASYALGVMVRKAAQGQRYITMKLPARFYTLELADVVQVNSHPLVGGLFQVTRLTTDFMQGQVEAQAVQLLDLTNPV